MKKGTHLLFVILLILVVGMTPANGQGKFKSGYIRTLNDNIEYGFVQQSTDADQYQRVRFKENLTDTIEEYNASEILGYGFGYRNGAEFMSRIISTDNNRSTHRFLEILVPYGKVRLFAAGETFYISSGKANVIELTEENLKATLSASLTGCSYVDKEISSAKLSRRQLVSLFKDYHECSKGDGTSYIGARSFDPALKISILASMDFFALKPESNNHSLGYGMQIMTDQNPARIGMQLSKSFSHKLDARLGITYKRRYLTGEVSPTPYVVVYAEELLPYHPAPTKLTLYFNEIQIPLSLTYSFLEKKSGGWFGRGGASFVFTGKPYSNYSSTFYMPTAMPYIYYPVQRTIGSVKFSPRLSAGFGHYFNADGKKSVTLELYGEWGNGSVKYSDQWSTSVSTKSASVNLMVGFIL